MLRDIERTVLYLRSGNCSACKKQITIFIFDGTIMTGCLISMSIKCQNFLNGIFIFFDPAISYKLCAIMILHFSLTDGQCHIYGCLLSSSKTLVHHFCAIVKASFFVCRGFMEKYLYGGHPNEGE